MWDVTDGDIDRFSKTLLDGWLRGASLARAVHDARASCTLQHLVGAAPICYGLPIRFK